MGIGVLGALLTGCPPTTCSSNADCDEGQVCVLGGGAGTCAARSDGDDAGTPDAGALVDDAGPDDAGPDDAGADAGLDAGPDDAGPDDAGPDDAGPDDAGPDTGPALTSAPSGGGATHAGGAVRLRARVRSAEPAAPLRGGALELAPPRR